MVHSLHGIAYMQKEKTIWTIGHSTHTLDEFLEMLHSFKIKVLADVRSYPGSRKFPQFNKESLAITLPENGIAYIHIGKLGGRRKVSPSSKNTVWRHPAFRGYADYMETDEFKEGMDELISIARRERTAFMCSEAVWWRCHRSMISDHLKAAGWKVMHILSPQKTSEHPYTSAASIVDGELHYGDPGMDNK